MKYSRVWRDLGQPEPLLPVVRQFAIQLLTLGLVVMIAGAILILAVMIGPQ